MRAINLLGHTFSRLTVIRQVENRGQKRCWECRCKCGQLTTVSQGNLTEGVTKSCGCFRAELDVARRDAPAVTDLPEYWVWGAMVARCHNPRCKGFYNYGGRGIIVCASWRGQGGFNGFIGDMGPRPTQSHTLDRIDNNGPYSPENCRWATRHSQSRNTRRNRPLSLNGRTMVLEDWASELNINSSTLICRLDRYGWSVERALTTIPKSRILTHAGQSLTLAEWSRQTGLKIATLLYRLRAGWSITATLTTPAIHGSNQCLRKRC